MYEQSYEFTFEAAHTLAEAVPGQEGHRYANIHGHSFLCCVTLRATELQDQGWVVDFDVLRAACQKVFTKFDHRFLNGMEGLGDFPTMENMSAFIADMIRAEGLPIYAVTLSRPSLKEKVRFYAHGV